MDVYMVVVVVVAGGQGGGGGVGASFRPHHTNVCKISRLWGAVSSMVVNKSLSNLAILLILRRSFHWCRRFCPNLLMSKVEKKWKGLLDVCWQKIRTAAFASNSNTSNINSNISRTVPRPFLSHWRGEFVFKSNIWSQVITSFIVKTFLYDNGLCWGLKSLDGMLLESTQGRI